MKSTARIGGHPIHPMLIPYPFAFLSGAMAFDVAGRVARNRDWWTVGRQLNRTGIATALMAAVPGLMDYVFTVPDRSRAKRVATYHIASNVGGLSAFALAETMRRRDDGRPSWSCLALEVIGTAALGLGGWLGGSLVYHHEIGVDRDPAAERMKELPAPPHGDRLGAQLPASIPLSSE